mmetsp:Transcript_28347/g.41175  ORF Transcript_28347/g.41175 Transcript_28347/m.41175 type:complete len:391 (-) Transcript_28347:911-2083(-)
MIAVSLMDVLWTFQKFAEIGDKYGCFPKKLKNKVLTNTLGISILDFIDDQQVHQDLSTAINQYTKKGEESEGIIVIGIPIGSKKIVNTTLEDFCDMLDHDTSTIATMISNKQTLGQIYSSCLLARTPFRMLANVAANADPDDDYISSEWPSPTTESIMGTTKKLLCHIMGIQQLPHHAYLLATLPERKSSIGLFEPSCSAIPAFVIAVTQSIWYAHLGINLDGNKVHLSRYIRDIFVDWDTSTLHLFCLYRTLCLPLLQHIKTPSHFAHLNPLTYFTKYHNLGSLQHSYNRREAQLSKQALFTYPEHFCSYDLSFTTSESDTDTSDLGNISPYEKDVSLAQATDQSSTPPLCDDIHNFTSFPVPITGADLQQALLSIFMSDAGLALLASL